MRATYEQQYLGHMQMLIEANKKQDRTGTGTRSIFGPQMVADLRDGFPLLTTKSVFTKGVVAELIWFLKGDTNIKYLTDRGVHIWDEWATEEGELGPVYGKMWRSWPLRNGTLVDQIRKMVNEIKEVPHSRRNIVSSWNVEFLPDTSMSPEKNAKLGKQALPPCHTLFQVNCEEIPNAEYGAKYYLDMKLYQRSADWFLGVPFNVASYSLLLMMLAQTCNMVPRYFIHTFGDTHVYNNHIEQCEEQLSREILPMCNVVLNPDIEDIDDFDIDDVTFRDYEHHPAIKAKVSK